MPTPKTSVIASTLAVFLSLVLIAAPQAAALEVQISPTGDILFYEDGVLGESTEKNGSTRTYQPTERYSARSNSQLKIQALKNSIQVGVVEDSETDDIDEVDQREVKRLRAEFPARVTPLQLKDAKETRMMELEDDESFQAELEMREQKMTEKTEQEREQALERVKEHRTDYLDSLQERRLERTDAIELRNRLNDSGQQELEIESAGQRAALRGAEFTYDPDENMITVTTPAGQEKTLNHLPDQAIERMKAIVTINTNGADEPELDVEVGQNENLYYRTRYDKTKKFLGVFDRKITTDVVLDDETGQVTEIEQPSRGVLGRFLDVFTL